MYTYEIADNPPMCKILNGEEVIDLSGPWESVEAAEGWAIEFTNKLNSESV
jgi:hypothetical protein